MQTLAARSSPANVGLDKQALILKTGDGEIRHPIADVLLITLGSADPVPAGTIPIWN